MRKGATLTELLVIITTFVIVSLPLARLSTVTLRDIPAAFRITQSNTSLLNALRKIQNDVNAARAFPKSFGHYTTNSETFLIELANNTICYQLKDDELLRRKLLKVDTTAPEDIECWPVPNSNIQWRLLQRDGTDYALEIKTFIEQRTEGHLQKKMANSHLFFVGAYQEAVN